MRKLLLIAGLAALALPGIAAAQPGCAQQRHDNRVADTVVGAGLGAVLGGAVAIGNVAGGASTPCSGYTQAGYYDNNGVWHAGPGHYDANGEWQSASGYYDGAGNWVDAAPPPPVSAPAPPPPYAGDYGADAAYTGSDDVRGR